MLWTTGWSRSREEFFVGIDADTIIAPDAISKLVPHFSNPKVAAMAGNAKVGNRVNLWTRWQALEYITSQNFERRALEHVECRQRCSRRHRSVAHRRGSRRRRLSPRHRRRRCRSHHGAAAGRLLGELRRSRPGLHRSSQHGEWPDAATLPLVLRHHAGGMETSPGSQAERSAGLGRDSQHGDLPDPAAAGFAVHRYHVRGGH